MELLMSEWPHRDLSKVLVVLRKGVVDPNSQRPDAALIRSEPFIRGQPVSEVKVGQIVRYMAETPGLLWAGCQLIRSHQDFM